MNKIALTAIVIVIVAIITGFWVVGSPQRQRQEKVDQIRVNNLQNINWAIEEYWNKKEALPSTLDDLAGQISHYLGEAAFKDPETGERYNYVKTGDETFELCADFFTDNSNDDKEDIYSMSYPYPYLAWTHSSGNYCFKFKVGESQINKPRQIVPISL